jgi:hypothetical protein
MMNNTWNLDGKRVTKKGWAGEYWSPYHFLQERLIAPNW